MKGRFSFCRGCAGEAHSTVNTKGTINYFLRGHGRQCVSVFLGREPSDEILNEWEAYQHEHSENPAGDGAANDNRFAANDDDPGDGGGSGGLPLFGG